MRNLNVRSKSPYNKRDIVSLSIWILTSSVGDMRLLELLIIALQYYIFALNTIITFASLISQSEIASQNRYRSVSLNVNYKCLYKEFNLYSNSMARGWGVSNDVLYSCKIELYNNRYLEILEVRVHT